MKKISFSLILLLLSLAVTAQPRFSQPHGLYDGNSLTVEIAVDDAKSSIRYTKDGSEPPSRACSIRVR